MYPHLVMYTKRFSDYITNSNINASEQHNFNVISNTNYVAQISSHYNNQ